MSEEQVNKLIEMAKKVLSEQRTLNGIGPAFKAEYKGIDEICKKADLLDSKQSLINLWTLEVRPFFRDISLSHLEFMQEYIDEKIEKLN